MIKVIPMEASENAKKKVGDGYDTLRVKSELKAKILKIQNEYFAQSNRKISVSELNRQALEAREHRESKHTAPKRKPA
jgi:hypothetical protein